MRPIKKRGLNEKPSKCLQQGPTPGECLSDCHLNKQRLINPLEAEVNERVGRIEETQTTPPYRISPILRGSQKVLKILEDVQADIKGLKQGQQGLEAGQQALQDDVTAVKADAAKIPGLEQRLEHHGTLLTGLTATTATVLEEQHAQRSDIRTLHTEVHETREELKEEIRAARAEAKRDNMDLKATVVKKIQSDERRITNIEEHAGIENPEKH